MWVIRASSDNDHSLPSAKTMRIDVTLLVTVRPDSTALPAIVGLPSPLIGDGHRHR
jgi:hypothetical protein